MKHHEFIYRENMNSHKVRRENTVSMTSGVVAIEKMSASGRNLGLSEYLIVAVSNKILHQVQN